MDKIKVNPWTWQDRRGFSQGWKITGASSLVFVSGQVPLSPEGELVEPDNFEGQVRQTFTNMRAVLEQAGASFDDVVMVTAYLTDISLLRDFGRVRDEFVNTSAPPGSTAVGVSALALPGIMIEVDAIAVV